MILSFRKYHFYDFLYILKIYLLLYKKKDYEIKNKYMNHNIMRKLMYYNHIIKYLRKSYKSVNVLYAQTLLIYSLVAV
ncbi:hypothetical protein M951_chr382 (nucleomorph) [Lotharella oceanica]|uniref:Uncharacterized protein n=1 Tax=Lotharella oceanica TaxID=641309 RepID=A0A060D7P9_9EUKA|nr:hypothetical protein M951_chr382 [Lotharella oceanica]